MHSKVGPGNTLTVDANTAASDKPIRFSSGAWGFGAPIAVSGAVLFGASSGLVTGLASKRPTVVGALANVPGAAVVQVASGLDQRSMEWPAWLVAIGSGIAGAHLASLAGVKSPTALGAAAGATWSAVDAVVSMVEDKA